MEIPEIKRIDWRKVEKTDDINYLRAVAKKVGVNFVGVKAEELRTKVLAERRIGRKPLEHKPIGKRDLNACDKLPSKSAQIQYLFNKGYHPAVISTHTSMHITNVYACLRRAGLYNTGKTIKKSVIAKIKATIAEKQKVTADA